MTLGNIIKSYREENSLSMDEFSKKSNISKAYISLLEKNKHPKTGKTIAPSIDCIKLAASAMDMQFDDVFNMIDGEVSINRVTTPKKDTRKGIIINVLGRVAAGIPIEAIEDIIDTEEITKEMASTGDFFGLQIHGDSMEPRIAEGDVVIVRQQEYAESGDTVIALINGDDATCKRLKKYEHGIMLLSNNPAYEPMVFSEKDIQDKPVTILGKVVELRAKF